MNPGTCEEDLEWEEWNPSKISFVNHMVAGSVAGVVEHVSIYPIDTVKTHIQYEKSASFKPLHSFRSLTQGQGGFFRLWRGVSAMFAGCIPAHAAYFSVFEASKKLLGADKQGHHPLQAAACGALAAVSHDSFLTPFDVVKQRMQLGYYKSVPHCVRTILKTEGLRALYSSFPTTLMMNIPFGGVMVAVNESVKKVLIPDGEFDFWMTMVSGSIAGTVAAAATNPLDVVKTRLQTQNLEHCTKSCEDPHFNPVPPNGTTGATVGASSSGAGANTPAGVRPGKSPKGVALEGPSARSYRRARPLLPQLGGALAEPTLAANTSKMNLWRKGALSSSGGVAGSTGTSSGVGRAQAGLLFSAGAGGASSGGVGSRVPNMRMRALMTSASPRLSLGSYSKPRGSTGSVLFTIKRSAVVRALCSAGPHQSASSASITYQSLGMVQMAKQIYAAEGMMGFAKGIVPRMMVHAPSVAISWTAYETMKVILMGDGA